MIDSTSLNASLQNTFLPSTFNFTVPTKLELNNYKTQKTEVIPPIEANDLEALINGTRPKPNTFLTPSLGTEEAINIPILNYLIWKRKDQTLLGCYSIFQKVY